MQKKILSLNFFCQGRIPPSPLYVQGRIPPSPSYCQVRIPLSPPYCQGRIPPSPTHCQGRIPPSPPYYQGRIPPSPPYCPVMCTNIRIFKYSNKMALKYYSYLYSCHFPNTNIFGYSFVDFWTTEYIRICVRKFSKIR